YRPPRTVFDFIQRRGRAGREEGDLAYTVMVLGQDPSDHFYLTRRHRLINGQYALPLNPDNPVVETIHNLLEQARQEVFRGIQAKNKEKLGVWTWLISKLYGSSILRQ